MVPNAGNPVGLAWAPKGVAPRVKVEADVWVPNPVGLAVNIPEALVVPVCG